MSQDMHQRAREWLSLGGPPNSAEARWLLEHVATCESCREYGEGMQQGLRALRAIPFAAKPDLARLTQARVRMRAQELRDRQERFWLVWVSCSLVTVFALCSSTFVWKVFDWLGSRAHVPSAVWQVGFAMFWIAPTVAASFLLLAHGTHLADRNGGSRG